MYRTKQRLLETSTAGLRGVRVAPRATRGPDPAAAATPAFQSAEEKRARKRRRNLENVVAGGWWAPTDVGDGP
jgi:hypothetical protein